MYPNSNSYIVWLTRQEACQVMFPLATIEGGPLFMFSKYFLCLECWN